MNCTLSRTFTTNSTCPSPFLSHGNVSLRLVCLSPILLLMIFLNAGVITPVPVLRVHLAFALIHFGCCVS